LVLAGAGLLVFAAAASADQAGVAVDQPECHSPGCTACRHIGPGFDPHRWQPTARYGPGADPHGWGPRERYGPNADPHGWRPNSRLGPYADPHG
jgi:hypothetical protein